MTIVDKIKENIKLVFLKTYNKDVSLDNIKIRIDTNRTEIDYVIILFNLKLPNVSPAEMIHSIGMYLLSTMPEIESFTIEKGYLNICVTSKFLIDRFYDDCYIKTKK